MSAFQEASAWVLDLEHCPCDLELMEYLKAEGIKGKSLFHFGTGVHHLVGLENQTLDRPNEILGITASALEHQSYAKAVVKDSTLAKYYKVLFSDIYLLTPNTVPMFDIVTLFHLCEFYLPENAAQLHQTDESLVQLFLDKLNPGGRILFYTGSLGFYQTAPILEAFVNAGKLTQVGKYKKLLVYEKGSIA
jgi:SAM-dependent methyltransferase